MPTENPLLEVHVPVPFADARAEHILPAVDRLLDVAQKRLEAIGDAPRSRATTLEAFDLATSELDFASNVASHLESVIGTPELRAAWGAALPKLTELYSRIVLSEPLYRALREYAATDDAKALDPGRARFLEKTLADFRRNGAELDPKGKERLAAIDVALGELTLKFVQNVTDATAAFDVVETDPSKLKGLPPGVLEAAKKSAADKGKDGYRFTLQAPSFGPVMSFAENRELRKQLYFAQNTRATKAPHDNRPLIKQVLELRREKAKLLGFEHWADLVIQDRMAKTGKDALAFVTMLRDRLLSAFERENAELAAFAKKHGHEGPLEPWDVTFFAEKQRRALYDFDEETLRPYFPLDRVQRGLFEVASSLYRITIERDPSAKVWHEDVTAWSVTDATSKKRIGTFYLDLFPRETKRDGAWMGGVVDRLPSTTNERENVAVIVANMTPPRATGQPALLNHREVETLFHEFGHMMHHVLSEVPVRSQAGTRVVSDFVELPSMIMENWCWEREALDRFARHHETGAPIPDDVKDRMLRARTYRAANLLMRQLGFSTVDLTLHTSFDPSTGDAMAVAREVFGRFSPVPLPADYAMLASFSHLFGSSYGYSAGYYSYQWSEMLEADAFSRFRDGGILSAEVGDRFRREILSRGDQDDPAVLYRAFLGRDPDVEALLKRLGCA